MRNYAGRLGHLIILTCLQPLRDLVNCTSEDGRGLRFPLALGRLVQLVGPADQLVAAAQFARTTR